MKNQSIEKADLKPREPAGRRPTLKHRKILCVSLTEEHAKKASAIGMGNMSAGIRMVLDEVRISDYSTIGKTDQG